MTNRITGHITVGCSQCDASYAIDLKEYFDESAFSREAPKEIVAGILREKSSGWVYRDEDFTCPDHLDTGGRQAYATPLEDGRVEVKIYLTREEIAKYRDVEFRVTVKP